MAALLDVNVLIALSWPNHEHHARAMRWFSRRGTEGWATCPSTQCGLVRISCNPKVVGVAVSVAEALVVLGRITALPGHEFWPDDLDAATALRPWSTRLTGYRQVADAYLLSMAISRGGRLATLDEAMARTAAYQGIVDVVS